MHQENLPTYLLMTRLSPAVGTDRSTTLFALSTHTYLTKGLTDLQFPHNHGAHLSVTVDQSECEGQWITCTASGSTDSLLVFAFWIIYFS